LAAGLCVTVNSDDPAYFGGYLNDNFVQLFESLPQLTAHDAYTMLRNSIEGAFVHDEDKGLWIEELDSVFAAIEP
jgi:adenosine deaminase